jgi:hypothetical protein
MTRWIARAVAIASATLTAVVWARRLRLFKAFRLARKALALPSALRGAKH